MEKREKCYGYIRDGKNGCRWLEKSPSENECFSCSFYKTEKDFYRGQYESNKMLKRKGIKPKIKTQKGLCIVTTTEDYDYKEEY